MLSDEFNVTYFVLFAFRPITLPAFNVSSTVETTANLFSVDQADSPVDPSTQDALELERQALQGFEV